MAVLFEKCRPATWNEVIGQDAAVKTLQRVKPGARAYYIQGPSGTGKTTLARLVAKSFADPLYIDEIDAADCSLEYLRSMESEFRYRGLGELQGKAWIVNEVHCLRGAILSRFLTVLEQLPEHCTVIFTTSKGRQAMFAEFDDASPFLSRCTVVTMQVEENKTPFAKDAGPVTRKLAEHVRKIAIAEGLDGKPIESYIGLAMRCQNNVRMMLSEVDAGKMLEGGA